MKHNALYKMRRKLQVLAYNFTSPEFVSKIYFKKVLGYKLDLKEPKTLNEKIQWLKLYEWPNNPIAIQCASKYNVRAYVEEKGCGKYLNDLLGVYDSVDEIEWDKLPERFVLKGTHGCGYNIICADKTKLQEKEAKKKLKKWLKEDFGKFNAEPHYSKMKPQIVCDKFLGSDIANYNVFCCNGEPLFISVIEGLGAGVDEALTYYYANGEIAPFKSRSYPISDKKLPECVEEMKDVARILAKDVPFVRIDFYLVEGKILLSEMTFTPGGGLIPFAPIEYDKVLGEKLDISELIKAKEEKNNVR